jgi:cytochrome c551/c552
MKFGAFGGSKAARSDTCYVPRACVRCVNSDVEAGGQNLDEISQNLRPKNIETQNKIWGGQERNSGKGQMVAHLRKVWRADKLWD